MVVLEGVGAALRLFDEFAVGYTGCRPGLGEMVGVELVQVSVTGHTADDDMFVVFAAFFDGAHGSVIKFDGQNGIQVTHTAGTVCGNKRRRDRQKNSVLQTQKYLCFQMACHVI